MKTILNLLIPILVVATIFIGSQIWTKNYDLHYTKTASKITTIQDIVQKKAATHAMTKMVGNVVRSFPVHKPAHRVLTVEIEGKRYEIENFNLKSRLRVGDSVKICYNKPAYFGEIFGLRIVGKRMGCKL